MPLLCVHRLQWQALQPSTTRCVQACRAHTAQMLCTQEEAKDLDEELAKAREFVTAHIGPLIWEATDAKAAATAAQSETAALREAVAGANATHERAAAEAQTINVALQVRLHMS